MQRTIQLFYPRQWSQKQSPFTNPVSQTHVGDHAAARMSAGDDNNPTSWGRKKASSLNGAKISSAASRGDRFCASRISPVPAVIRRAGGSIGCLAVVRFYSRRYCRVGVQQCPANFPSGRRNCAWQSLMAGSRPARDNTRNLKIKIIFLEAI